MKVSDGLPIHCLCIDGYSASIRNLKHRNRPYMSNVVFDILKRDSDFFGFDYTFDSIRAGRARWKRRYLLYKLNSLKSGTLLLVAKSYGVRVLDFLFREMQEKRYEHLLERFSRVGIVCIDGHYPFRRDRLIYLSIPSANCRIINLFQTRSSPLVGAYIKGTCLCLNRFLIDKNIDHWNIISQPDVTKAIQMMERYLLFGNDNFDFDIPVDPYVQKDPDDKPPF